MDRFGVILAGGQGVRLRPLTHGVNKHLLPVYDKPMIAHAVDFMLEVGIDRIAIVTNSNDMDQMSVMMSMIYPSRNLYIVEQEENKGVAAALRSARCLNGDNDMLVMLGDNMFYGEKFVEVAKAISNLKQGQAGCIAVHQPESARDSCVVTLNKKGQPVKLVEKPKSTTSPWVVTGLYSYPDGVFEFIDELKPSDRGELEITDLNKHYLRERKLVVEKVALNSRTQWLDMGTPTNLLKAGMLRYATRH